MRRICGLSAEDVGLFAKECGLFAEICGLFAEDVCVSNLQKVYEKTRKYLLS